MERRIDLCGPCCVLMRGSYVLERVAAGVNNKVSCGRCGKRRYGATYELIKKKETGR